MCIIDNWTQFQFHSLKLSSSQNRSQSYLSTVAFTINEALNKKYSKYKTYSNNFNFRRRRQSTNIFYTKLYSKLRCLASLGSLRSLRTASLTSPHSRPRCETVTYLLCSVINACAISSCILFIYFRRLMSKCIFRYCVVYCI